MYSNVMKCTLRLLVTEWSNVEPDVQKQREKKLQEKIRVWDNEVNDELNSLNKMASPPARKRPRQSSCEEKSSDDRHSEPEDGSETEATSQKAQPAASDPPQKRAPSHDHVEDPGRTS